MCVLIVSNIKYVFFLFYRIRNMFFDFIEYKICVLILSNIKYVCFDFIEHKICVF